MAERGADSAHSVVSGTLFALSMKIFLEVLISENSQSRMSRTKIPEA